VKGMVQTQFSSQKSLWAYYIFKHQCLPVIHAGLWSARYSPEEAPHLIFLVIPTNNQTGLTLFMRRGQSTVTRYFHKNP